MTYTANTPIFGHSVTTAAEIQAWFESRGPAYAPQYAPDGTYKAPPSDLGAAIVAECRRHLEVNHDMVAAQILHETAAWQSKYARERNNPGGIGAINSDPDQAHWFPSVAAGVRAHVAHLLVYSIGDGLWSADTPRRDAVAARGWLGVVKVWGDLNGRWAHPGTTYGQGIAALANSLVTFAASQPGQEPPMADLTTTIGNRIGAHGVEVHDIRDKMTRHDSDRYDRRPNSAWQYTAVHHTAADRDVRNLAGDITSWRGHSTYHVDTRGWPGIAYAIGVSQSGRVFLLRDIEEMGYHAFTANNVALAVCGDVGMGIEPTAAMQASLAAVLGVLHTETPELPGLKRSSTYMHRELAFIDSRNAETVCAGQLAPFVTAYRANTSTPPGPPPAPPADSLSPDPASPDPYRAENPHGSHWIPNDILHAINQAIATGGFLSVGYVIGGAVVEADQLRVYTERNRWERHRDGSIHRGLVGVELRMTQREIERLQARVAELERRAA